jgi:RNA polymerase sigma factor (sigma-70 family)
MDDRQWIRIALEQYEQPLLKYTTHLLSDAERARDVVQDAFLRLCRQDRATVEGHLAQWLYTVCRNRAFDVRRKEKKMTNMSTDQAIQQTSRGADHTTQTENQDVVEQVYSILEGFSENQQEVIRLKFQHGMSYREISKITSLSVSNVGFLIHTALERVRQKLGVTGPATN